MMFPGNGRGDLSGSDMVVEYLASFSTTAEARVSNLHMAGPVVSILLIPCSIRVVDDIATFALDTSEECPPSAFQSTPRL